jgi:hypothetical protein
LLSTSIKYFLDEKTKEVTRMNFKAVLLLFLLLFVSVGTIALVNFGIMPKNVKTATSALGFGGVRPAGGDPVDNPRPS